MKYKSMRRTFTLDERIAEQARAFGVNMSAAARDWVATEACDAIAANDRAAYERRPELSDTFWNDAQAWRGG